MKLVTKFIPEPLKKGLRVLREIWRRSTRPPQESLPDGSPKNYWHLREWTEDELNAIFAEVGFKVEWNFLNGPSGWRAIFTVTEIPTEDTLSLVPVILLGISGDANE